MYVHLSSKCDCIYIYKQWGTWYDMILDTHITWQVCFWLYFTKKKTRQREINTYKMTVFSLMGAVLIISPAHISSSWLDTSWGSKEPPVPWWQIRLWPPVLESFWGLLRLYFSGTQTWDALWNRRIPEGIHGQDTAALRGRQHILRSLKQSEAPEYNRLIFHECVLINSHSCTAW